MIVKIEPLRRPLLSVCMFLPGMKSNPPRLASRLWFTSSYMREGVEGMGEGAYCLTQLASALEFASHVDASVLADITEDELNEVRQTVCTMILHACRCMTTGEVGLLIFLGRLGGGEGRGGGVVLCTGRVGLC